MPTDLREHRIARHEHEVRVRRVHDPVAWRRSLHTAGQLEMRYELGRAYGEIGRHLAKENPARVMHLTRAVELLSEVGAASDLARLAER